MGNQKAQPFTSFGQALRRLRESMKRTQAEVSGAVEIDQALLQKYESGELRPTEDILMLLIQHFQLKEKEASELWRLAGYFQNTNAYHNFDMDDQFHAQTNNHTQPIVYTDMIQVMVNNYGVIVQFMQGAGVSSEPLAVARVGMSKEHAKSVLEVLQKTLQQADNTQVANVAPRLLPKTTKNRNDSSKNS